MKRFLLIIISALCVLSLVSCDGANNDNNDTVISEVSIPGSSASVSFGNANSYNNDTTTSEVSAPESAAASYEVVTWERRDYLTVSVGCIRETWCPMSRLLWRLHRRYLIIQ